MSKWWQAPEPGACWAPYGPWGILQTGPHRSPRQVLLDLLDALRLER